MSDGESIKYLYCPSCKKWPDKIIETSQARMYREWNGECYEELETEFEEDFIYNFCGECQTELIEKEEVGKPSKGVLSS